MTNFVPLALSDLESGDVATADQGRAFYNNPIALTEVDQAAIDAGIIVNGVWYPYDIANPSGIIWDHDVDGNSTITTPPMQPKFEYKLECTRLAAGGERDIRVQVNLASSGFTTQIDLIDAEINEGTNFTGVIQIPDPYRGADQMLLTAVGRRNLGPDSGYASSAVFTTNGEAVLNIRLSSETGNFTGGKVRMFKRRSFY